jgi:hypothetical protein
MMDFHKKNKASQSTSPLTLKNKKEMDLMQLAIIVLISTDDDYQTTEALSFLFVELHLESFDLYQTTYMK